MHSKFRGKLIRFWQSDKGLSAFLGLLILSALVLYPLTVGLGVGRVLNEIAVTLTRTGGIAAASERPRVLALVASTIAVTLVLRWLGWIIPSTGLLQLQALFLFLSFGMLALVILGQVFRDGPVSHHRIQGAIAVYLLLGMAWAAVYELIDLLVPGSFTGTFGTGQVAEQSWLYFSYATLTTVGYGDIVPVHPIARSMAVSEAMMGQFYVAILVARLVSQQIVDRGNRTRT
jgi:hypothetical protein